MLLEFNNERQGGTSVPHRQRTGFDRIEGRSGTEAGETGTVDKNVAVRSTLVQQRSTNLNTC
jgi:hypothetical protein